MHFFTAPLALVLFAASALAQTISISYPLNGSTINPGSNYTVELSFPIYIQNVDWVSVVVGLDDCTYISGCPTGGPLNGLGSVLAQAPFTPAHDAVGNTIQNITVTIPATAATGKWASLGVVGFYIVGASYTPGLNSDNVTLYVE